MAIKYFGTDDAQTVKTWSKILTQQTIDRTYLNNFSGESEDNVFQIKTETSKGPGDRVSVGLLGLLTGAGLQGSNAQYEGNEEALTLYNDNLYIDQFGHSAQTSTDSTIDWQRIPFELRSRLSGLLSAYFAKRLDVCAFNQVAGYNATSGVGVEFLGNDTRWTGMQATIAPSSGRVIRPAAVTADESLTSAHKITLNLIDQAVAVAETDPRDGTPLFRPASIPNYSAAKYVLFVHPWQANDFRTDAITAGNWHDIQLSAMKGGEVDGNPLFKGGDVVGFYNSTLIMKSSYIPYGVNSSTTAAVTGVRRAVFCGAQAAIMAYGQKNQDGEFQWVEELFNYKKRVGVNATLIYGIKKSVFNSVDYAVITIPTYATNPQTGV